MLTLEQARTERLEAECRRLMRAAARIDRSRDDGGREREAALAAVDHVLDQLALALPDEW